MNLGAHHHYHCNSDVNAVRAVEVLVLEAKQAPDSWSKSCSLIHVLKVYKQTSQEYRALHDGDFHTSEGCSSNAEIKVLFLVTVETLFSRASYLEQLPLIYFVTY